MAEGRGKQKATKDTEEKQYESKCGKCNKPVTEQDNGVNTIVRYVKYGSTVNARGCLKPCTKFLTSITQTCTGSVNPAM